MSAQPANPDPVIETAVRDAVARTGFDLENLEEVRAGQRRLIRVIIDSDDGVGLDDIASVSREVSLALDQHDALVTGPYHLEVTSPGVDRPLTQPRHWRRNRRRLVRTALIAGGELVGRIGDCDEEGVTLLASGALRRVLYTELRRAVVEVEFRPPPAAELAALDGERGHDWEER
ncbi:MAG TPA: ribosome maturation factor RimP [Pseudonocardiaceae bacterium]|nr:ribosome maturation factor RimP [Pseudonocardiaceae bacterium]